MKKNLLLLLAMLAVAYSTMSATPALRSALTDPVPDTVIVSKVDSLRLAISGATGDRIILLRTCSDADGYYKLLATGTPFPKTFINLEIKNYPGDDAKIYGSLGSNSDTARMKLKSFKVTGLNFERVEAGDAEGMNPFYLAARDSITTGLFVTGCRFKDLGTASRARILRVNGANLVCEKIVFDNNMFKNFGGTTPSGTNGQNMFQFGNFAMNCDSFVLKNNVIEDFHGGQFINNNRTVKTTSADSALYIVVENNTFVRFGGNGASDRNFIEWTNKMGTIKAYITIQNNLFYKNWSTAFSKCWRLHIFTRDTSQVQEVRVLNNYFEPSDVVKSLATTNTTRTPSVSLYNNFTKESFGIVNTFIDTLNLVMSTRSPLYTASTTGGPIGLASLYTSSASDSRTLCQTVQVNSLTGLKNAITTAVDGDTIELLNCTDAVGYYRLGTTGLAYPAKFVNLTIRPATGNTPLLYGSFGSNGTPRMKLKNLTFNGVTFKADLTDLAENNQCFYLQANDSITGGLFYNNCKFQDLGGAASGPRIFYAKSCTNALLKKLVYDGCTFKNYGGAVADGATGNHFLHFNNAAYICDSVVLKNSYIIDWHGSQFINIGRQSTNNKDSLFTLIVENNTFYKFGGNATSNRNFVECTKDFGGSDVNMTIKNNLFYQRWGKNKPVMNLALFTPQVGQILKVDVLNNFFEPDTVVALLPVSAGAPTTINRVNLTKASFGLGVPTFINDSLLIMSTKSPLYVAGTTGGPVGAPSMYSDTTLVTRTAPATIQVNCIAGLKAAVKNAFDGDIIELLNCTDAAGYYALGKDGITYPSTFVDLTIRPATEQTPLVYGSFGSTGTPRMKIKSYTFDNVTFKADTLNNAEGYNPFYLTSTDSITTGLFYKNCKFLNMGYKSSGPRIFYAKSCALAVCHALVYDGCTFDNFGYLTPDGTNAEHFLHFNTGTYDCDSVVLKNSVISNWHGNQFINFGKEKLTTRKDSTMRLIVENNSFVRFGANATSLRNFVEYTRVVPGQKEEITIQNNLFYKRWGKNKPNCQLALHTPAAASGTLPAETLNVKVLNNYFDPDTVVNALPISAGVPTSITRNDLTKASLGMLYIPTFVNDTLLIMSTKSILYTAGTTGGCIGAPSLYTSDSVQVVGVEKVKTISKALNGYASSNMIYVLGTEKMVTLYNVIGQKLGTYTAEEAEQGIALKSKGIVIVNSGGETIRLMVR